MIGEKVKIELAARLIGAPDRRLQNRKWAKTDEEDFLNKIESFAASKMHNKTHSIQLVMITTMGVARGEHASIVNQSVVLDNLFSDRRTQIL